MSKFVVVKEAPKAEDLRPGEMVIDRPDFLEEIAENKRREGRGGQVGSNHLRYVVGTVGAKYDPELSAYTIRPHLFEGRPYTTDLEFSAILTDVFNQQYPKIFESYLDYKIRTRPTNTKLIYYVGNFVGTGAFFKNGFEPLDAKDVDAYMGGKPKKVVGKPAITDADVKGLNDNQT